MKPVFLAAMFLTLPATASDFSARYPTGSVRDAQQAQSALKDADAEMARIASRAAVREAECYKGILVNSCRGDVRREKELAEREVRRVRVEARDLQRRLDAEELGKRRAEKSAERAAKDAAKPTEQKPARAAPAPATREPNIEAGGVERPRPAQEKLNAAQRAENARKFQQKQAQAAQRAQEREAERTKNAERRASKRKQVEQREAEREAIRRKAVELEKKL